MSLFATTLAVSFLVVGMPHLLPCPAPRSNYADAPGTEDGQGRKQRTKPDNTNGQAESGQHLGHVDEALLLRKKAHECPVPKPGGLIGEVLGFKKQDTRIKPAKPRMETIIVDRRDTKQGSGERRNGQQ